MLSLLLPLLAAATAACPEPALPLEESAQAALGATQAADFDGLLAQVAELDARLLCTRAVIDPALVPELHLLHGLSAAYVEPPEDAHVLAAFRGLAAADPDNQRVAALTPSGHPLRARYEAAAASAGYAETVHLPEGEWAVDGRVGVASVPLGRASVLQRVEAGAVTETWYLWGEGLPEALQPAETPAHVTPPVDILPPTEPLISLPAPEPNPRAPKLLAAGAGAALALGATSYALAHRSYAAWEADRAEDPQAAHARWDGPNQAALVGAAVGGVAGVGLGVGALVTWRW